MKPAQPARSPRLSPADSGGPQPAQGCFGGPDPSHQESRRRVRHPTTRGPGRDFRATPTETLMRRPAGHRDARRCPVRASNLDPRQHVVESPPVVDRLTTPGHASDRYFDGQARSCCVSKLDVRSRALSNAFPWIVGSPPAYDRAAGADSCGQGGTDHCLRIVPSGAGPKTDRPRPSRASSARPAPGKGPRKIHPHDVRPQPTACCGRGGLADPGSEAGIRRAGVQRVRQQDKRALVGGSSGGAIVKARWLVSKERDRLESRRGRPAGSVRPIGHSSRNTRAAAARNAGPGQAVASGQGPRPDNRTSA